ncbi:MAG TPA: RNA methyltransferase [Flavobacteriaceae bacterium]|nr:RNA methyltransferase [Flavobacteriaceae bacterium]
MLSKNQIKLINSLQQKKYRNLHGLFIVEGKKSVNEFLQSDFELESLFVLENQEVKTKSQEINKIVINSNELKKISALKNANQVLAVFKIPKNIELVNNGLILALDDIKDPGNLGTIIRLCDWFGIKQLVCSLETVDCYNPKVVQASMGSLTRVNILYTDLKVYLSKTELPIYTTLLEGENVYKSKLPKDAIIIMGNEANGISDTISSFSTNKITIPNFSKTKQTESLNVAMATSIVLSEFKRDK